MLEDADAAIRCVEQLIVKKEEVKQGTVQQLLTGRTRLPGFTGPWTRTTLGQLGIFLKGRGVKRDDVRASGVPCLRYGELYTNFGDYTAKARSRVPPEIAATALQILSGDVLFAISGETREEIGKCVAYVGNTPAVAGGDIVVFRGSDFNPVYLALLANSRSVAIQKARAGQGDAVVHISSRAIASIEIKLPSHEEQVAIVAALTDVDAEITALRSRLDKARDVKTGMMQELLTGRTRLSAEEAV